MGEHLPEATWQAMYQATGLRIIDGIGSTEMLHIFISAAEDDVRPQLHRQARARLRRARRRRPWQPGPTGQARPLAVQGPTGCRYLADDRQRTYVQNGWSITGDTFVQDEDGYFWYRPAATTSSSPPGTTSTARMSRRP
ncbi:hypothetical protein [Pseudonocardia thermophila]|uniref:hypothetical protein n=1 Tax=Pseudonocardia thermophila TaxID=1848 RepID=UPI0031E5609E